MTDADKFCQQCGTKLREAVRFCESCGAAVAAPPAPPPAPPAIAVPPVPPPPAPIAAPVAPAPPAPAASVAVMPTAAVPTAPSRPVAARSGCGMFAGWVIVIGAIFWMLPEIVRYSTVHFAQPELLADIIVTALCFAAGCAVIGGAGRNKLLFAGILALLFGTLSVLDLLGRASNINFVLEDPLGTFKDAPAQKVTIIAFAAGSLFGDFLIAIGSLLTIFAWIGSGRGKR